MVQFANFYAEVPNKSAAAVKLEIEDTLEEQYGPLNKKPKSPCQFYQCRLKWGANAGIVPPESAHCSLLEEPSPLGLRLRKSPSLLDLIQMRLSQGNSATVSNGSFETGKKKDLRSNAALGTTDKLKASNFPASVLRIGSWESVSRYEGDLVAKCYYAKHKLVWEVLDGGLKSKIEIQWSDITALKATCPENGPGTLDIVLATQPLFFRETNPQPRKHTLWQATSDFTNGQASMHRRHFLQCPSGLLNKHFEKLIQCDPRLNSLSRQPDIILEYPYFEPRCCVFEDHGETKFHAPMVPGFQDPASPSPCNAPAQNETRVSTGRTRDKVPRSPSSVMFNHISVMDTCGLEENRRAIGNPTHWDEIRALGLQSSMLMCDVVNHIGHCNPILPTDSSLSKSMLEELTRNLNNDSQVVSASDEQSLMSRVDSLGCLLEPKDRDDEMAVETKPLVSDLDMGKEPKMSRKESYGELLMHLPRIASLPQFLFNMADDSGR